MKKISKIVSLVLMVFSLMSLAPRPAKAWLWVLDWYVFKWDAWDAPGAHTQWGRLAFGSGDCPVRGGCVLVSSSSVLDPRKWPASDRSMLEQKAGLPAGALGAATPISAEQLNALKRAKLVKALSPVSYAPKASVQ